MASLKLFEGEAVFSFVDENDGRRSECRIVFDDRLGNFGSIEAISTDDAEDAAYECHRIGEMHPERDDLVIRMWQV